MHRIADSLIGFKVGVLVPRISVLGLGFRVWGVGFRDLGVEACISLGVRHSP